MFLSSLELLLSIQYFVVFYPTFFKISLN
jgi:hypothetical protein